MVDILTQDQLKMLLNDFNPGCKIELTTLPGGKFSVSVEHPPYPTKAAYLAGEFPELIDVPITFKAASEKYGVVNQTIRNWVYRYHYVSVINAQARPVTINEAEVAYVARIYHSRDRSLGAGGAPLLDENGLPYRLKHPDLSRRRSGR